MNAKHVFVCKRNLIYGIVLDCNTKTVLYYVIVFNKHDISVINQLINQVFSYYPMAGLCECVHACVGERSTWCVCACNFIAHILHIIAHT